MALGLSIPLDAIPGVGSLLAKLDSYKAAFLAVPDRANKALDRLTLVRHTMAANNAPPSAQSDALGVEQTIKRVQTEWSAAASELSQLQAGGVHISLDTITTAGHLLSSVTFVLSNMKTLESSVDALASKYLTADQQRQLNAYTPSSAGTSPLVWLAVAVGAYYLLGRRGRRG